MSYLTASKLYDYLQCPHRVWRDIHGPQEEKILETNPFVNLLWEKGVKHEEKIISGLGNCLNLGEGSIEDRFSKTLEAMKHGEPLIYQGVIKYENLLGIPDLLQKMSDGSYMPLDIKSGSGLEGAEEDSEEEGKPKKHYAVQLCLYNEILRKLGFANHNLGKIIDINGKEVEYLLSDMMGKRSKETWQEFYERIKNEAAQLIQNQIANDPAMSSSCKLCPWYTSCKNWCQTSQDLTNVFYVGRSFRDRIRKDLKIANVNDFMRVSVDDVMNQKELEKKSGNKDFLSGIGESTLKKVIERTRVLYELKIPLIAEEMDFPEVEYELFFDIEDDPTQDFVYMHGIYERRVDEVRFLDFTAKEVSSEAEKEAWQNFWKYIHSLPQNNFAVYYFSAHEKTTYKRLQKRYPDVISVEELTAFFEHPNTIDLYSVVLKKTDWPVGSYSIKELATYLGFKWRDETPSGALSIQWFNEYLKTKDEAILKRILEYNEDDCKATMVLKDGLKTFKIGRG